MTLIAVHGRTMVADSRGYRGGVIIPLAHPKISRLKDGSLFGAAGWSMHTYALHEWARAGMDRKHPPSMADCSDDKDNAGVWLWLRQDGKVFIGNATMHCYEVAPPDYIGYETAGNIWYGAVLAGATAEQAIHIAIKHCSHVAGVPQIERLDIPDTLEHPEDGPHSIGQWI